MAPTGLIRSWHTREHSSAARSSDSTLAMAVADIGNSVRQGSGEGGAARITQSESLDAMTRGRLIHRARRSAKRAHHADPPSPIWNSMDKFDDSRRPHPRYPARRSCRDRLAGRQSRSCACAQAAPRSAARPMQARSPKPTRRRRRSFSKASRAYCRAWRWCRRKRPRWIDPTHVPDTFILVDPLDGTREFIAGRDEFTVNIAIVHDGRPVAGIVGAPALDTIWRGAVGPGAERLQLACGAHPEGRERTARRCEHRAHHGETWRAMVSRSHADPATEQWLTRFPAIERMDCGSSVKFCRIAEGRPMSIRGSAGPRNGILPRAMPCSAPPAAIVLTPEGEPASLRTGRAQSQGAVFRRLGRSPATRKRFSA